MDVLKKVKRKNIDKIRIPFYTFLPVKKLGIAIKWANAYKPSLRQPR